MKVVLPSCAVATVALLAASCNQSGDPCFTPASLVQDLRVLALAADPAQPVADLSTGAVEPVRLRALIARATGSGGTFDVSWALCVPGPEPLCPEETVVARDSAWQSDSSVEIRVPPDLVAAAREADPLHGEAGIPVLATLRVGGARPESASIPIYFAAPGQAVNHAPAMTGLRVASPGFPLRDPSMSVEMLSNTPNGLRPVLGPGTQEEYDTIDFAGHRVHLQERVRYSFYATDGLFLGRPQRGSVGLVVAYGSGSDDEADEPPPGTSDPPQGLIPLTSLGSSGTLWIVARDSRGAAAWLEVPVKVTAKDPRCDGDPSFSQCVLASFGCL